MLERGSSDLKDRGLEGALLVVDNSLSSIYIIFYRNAQFK